MPVVKDPAKVITVGVLPPILVKKLMRQMDIKHFLKLYSTCRDMEFIGDSLSKKFEYKLFSLELQLINHRFALYTPTRKDVLCCREPGDFAFKLLPCEFTIKLDITDEALEIILLMVEEFQLTCTKLIIDGGLSCTQGGLVRLFQALKAKELLCAGLLTPETYPTTIFKGFEFVSLVNTAYTEVDLYDFDVKKIKVNSPNLTARSINTMLAADFPIGQRSWMFQLWVSKEVDIDSMELMHPAAYDAHEVKRNLNTRMLYDRSQHQITVLGGLSNLEICVLPFKISKGIWLTLSRRVRGCRGNEAHERLVIQIKDNRCRIDKTEDVKEFLFQYLCPRHYAYVTGRCKLCRKQEPVCVCPIDKRNW